ncbi:hypothetical protein G5V59_03720 [Nocardioides sp. W3-2-3]|uniref:hypothetical protein n=1 Tax=Nocardioides convexus TaxID=2712224 RepID=UPI0024185AE7|nr:hypothetical protein [Nocardioides convexus]NGZ99755.1 hypothetical protein [Nocardioides convexus]
MKDTRQGARTTLYCATSPDVAAATGRYYDNRREKTPAKVVTDESRRRPVEPQRGVGRPAMMTAWTPNACAP